MAKERLLIHGSSWTVGAYKKSSTYNIDELVSGGIAELLSADFDVTNTSVQDNMNFGIWLGLANCKEYDKILVCQNDPLLDFGIWRNTDSAWLQQFPYTPDELIQSGINSLSKLITFLVDRFYSKLSEIGKPIYLIGGPGVVDIALADKYGLHVIGPDWITALVPVYTPVAIESSLELDYAMQWLSQTFPDQRNNLKQEFIELASLLDQKLALYKNNPDVFAYHHPTALGNFIYYQTVRKTLCYNEF